MLGSLKEKIGFLQEGISSTVRVRGLARPVDPHSFLADPDQAVFLQFGSGSSCFVNADPAFKNFVKITL